MNIHEEQEFYEKMSSLNTNQLLNIRGWLSDKDSEKDRERKIELIDIAIDTKEVRRRALNRWSYITSKLAQKK